MKKMRKIFIAFSALVLTFIWAGIAQSGGSYGQKIEYLSRDPAFSITAGDKVFDDWWFYHPDNGVTGINGNGGGPEDYIYVMPLPDGGNDPGPGLKYTMEPTLSISGQTSLDFLFGFRVTTLGNQLIKDNSLYLDLFNYNMSGFDSNITIAELITDQKLSPEPTITENSILLLGSKGVYYTTLSNPGVSMQLTDSANFQPTDTIYITTSIHLGGSDPGSYADLRQFTQRFSQTPEPTTMLLLGTGLVGVAGAARRRKKNQA